MRGDGSQPLHNILPGQHTFSHLSWTLILQHSSKLDCASCSMHILGPSFEDSVGQLWDAFFFVARFIMHVIVLLSILDLVCGRTSEQYDNSDNTVNIIVSQCMIVLLQVYCLVLLLGLSLLYFSFFRPVSTAQDIVLVSIMQQS